MKRRFACLFSRKRHDAVAEESGVVNESGAAVSKEATKKDQLINLWCAFFFLDLLLSMPCLCTAGALISKAMLILLVLITARIVYLHFKSRLTMKDMLIYEFIFLVVWVLGPMKH